MGVPSDRIRQEYYGETNLAVDTQDEVPEGLNRRVHVAVWGTQ